MVMVTVSFELTDREARDFGQFVKRAAVRNIGPLWTGGLDLAEEDEVFCAEQALRKVQKALASAGYSPR